jgi:SAM-dependent methyltransferase
MDDGPVAAALLAIAAGRLEEAERLVRAGAEDSALARALLRRLREHGDDVYADPVGFSRFIDGGGNVGLYAAAAGALRAEHASSAPATVLDIGCGDGRLSVAALRPGLSRLDLVEPSSALLAQAGDRLAGSGPLVVAHDATAEAFLAAEPERRWDLVQSTFALHALEPAARRATLAELADRTRRLVVIEFDVPAFEDRSPEHARYAAARYEAGLAEYAGDEAVTQGFRMPVLVGQFDAGRRRHTWEQPADAWTRDLMDAGFRTAGHDRLHDYWWATAHVITADGPASG